MIQCMTGVKPVEASSGGGWSPRRGGGRALGARGPLPAERGAGPDHPAARALEHRSHSLGTSVAESNLTHLNRHIDYGIWGGSFHE